MSWMRLIGETEPTIRSTDLLSVDHPAHPYPSQQMVRDSALLRGVLFLGILLGSYGIFYLLLSALQGNTRISFAQARCLELFACLTAYLILTIGIEGRHPPAEIAPPRIIGLIKGMILGVLLISLSVGILALLGGYSITGFNPGYDPWLDLFSLGLVAGISEEILMRGILLRLVEEGLGSWGAIAVSASVFGLLHITNVDGTLWGSIAIVIEAGLLFGAIYVLTRSLWWCIGLHMGWNIALGPVFGIVVSGNGVTDSWILPQVSGPDLLTGGVFGLEASLIPVILLGFLGISLLVYAQKAGRMILPMWIRKTRLLGSSTSEKT